jgi:hypothetical protein
MFCALTAILWERRGLIFMVTSCSIDRLYTVELGYSDLGCSDTLAIASNIEWY